MHEVGDLATSRELNARGKSLDEAPGSQPGVGCYLLLNCCEQAKSWSVHGTDLTLEAKDETTQVFFLISWGKRLRHERDTFQE